LSASPSKPPGVLVAATTSVAALAGRADMANDRQSAPTEHTLRNAKNWDMVFFLG